MSSFGVDNRKIQMHSLVQARLALSEGDPLWTHPERISHQLSQTRFPNGHSGNIWVSLIEHDSQADLHLRDDGFGLPAGFDHSAPTSLAMQFASDLKIQINGALEREPRSDTHFHIHFHPRPQHKQQQAAG
jgi:hypothetical protein